MFIKVLRYGLYGSVATSGVLLALDTYQNNGVNSNGIVRFGRATLAVNKLAFSVYCNFNRYN
jgi:hypothetical protein